MSRNYLYDLLFWRHKCLLSIDARVRATLFTQIESFVLAKFLGVEPHLKRVKRDSVFSQSDNNTATQNCGNECFTRVFWMFHFKWILASYEWIFLSITTNMSLRWARQIYSLISNANIYSKIEKKKKSLYIIKNTSDLLVHSDTFRIKFPSSK